MRRQIGMQPREAAVAASVKPGNGVVAIGRVVAVDAQIALAAKLDRSLSHIDTDALTPAGPQPPQFRSRERRCRNRGLRRSADRERGRQRRLSAGEFDILHCSIILTGGPQQPGEYIFDSGSGHGNRSMRKVFSH